MAEYFTGDSGGGASFPGWHGATVSVPITLPGWRLLTPAAPAYTQAGILRASMNTLWGHIAGDQMFTVLVRHLGSNAAYGESDAVDAILDVATGLYMVSIENLHMRGSAFSVTVTLLGLGAMTVLTYYLELKP